MSLQDKVFDVEAFLDVNASEGLRDDFSEICDALWAYETEGERLQAKMNTIRAFKKLVTEI